MKKIIIANSILLILILGLFVFGYYFINYPEDFNFIEVIKNAEWKYFGLIILQIFTFSLVVSLLPIKNYKFRHRFFSVLGILNLFLLSFLIVTSVYAFRRNRETFDHMVSEYKIAAEKDMKIGLIRYEYAGGLELPTANSEKMKNEIDSLTRTYGVIYQNSGCIVWELAIKAQEEYRKYTKPYLDKRNGEGWDIKMEKQIEQIINKYQ